MATRTYYKFERVEDINIPYSFKCEECGKDSKTMEAHITGNTATYNSTFRTISEKREEMLEEEAHQNLKKRLKEVYRDAEEKGVFCYEFKDKCPFCGEEQSWGVSGLKKKMFDTPIAIFVLGLMITGIALLGHYFSDYEYMSMQLVYILAGGTVLLTLFILGINLLKMKRKEKKTALHKEKNKPQIDWTEVKKIIEEE